MPALMPTDFAGTITWLGIVADRKVALEARAVGSLDLRFAGPVGEAHGGLTRPSCSRVLAQYKRGTTIRNTRQLALMSAEDIAAIAEGMGLATLDPALLGTSMVIEGLPDFSHLPPSSRLIMPGGAALVVDMENRPCTLPAKPIEAREPGKGARFKPAAAGRRGVTAWVECEGRVTIGDRVALHVPDQPAWQPVGRAQL